MKRKLLVLLSILSFSIFSACSGSSNESSVDTNINTSDLYVIDEPMKLSFSFGERSGIYTGSVVNGVPNGLGSFSSSNPEGDDWVYYGEWENGSFHGYGVSEFSNGQIITGFYANGLLNGRGVYFLPDDSIICGEFIDGELFTSYIESSAPNVNIEESEFKDKVTDLPDNISESDSLVNEKNQIDSANLNQKSYTIDALYEDGTYKVGHTIAAGSYCLINSKSSGSADIKISTDSLNQFSSIGLMLSTNTFAYFQLFDGEYLEITDGYVIPWDGTPINPSVSTDNIESGMYIVGVDIPSGEYEIINTSNSKAEYCVYSEIPSSKDYITISLDFVDVNSYITLKEGQYIILEDGMMKLCD